MQVINYFPAVGTAAAVCNFPYVLDYFISDISLLLFLCLTNYLFNALFNYFF